jgi:hypothetical protein
MIEPTVWPRTDRCDDATPAFVRDVEIRDYELALFMAPDPIEIETAWADGSDPYRCPDDILPGTTSPAEAGLLIAKTVRATGGRRIS